LLVKAFGIESEFGPDFAPHFAPKAIQTRGKRKLTKLEIQHKIEKQNNNHAYIKNSRFRKLLQVSFT